MPPIRPFAEISFLSQVRLSATNLRYASTYLHVTTLWPPSLDVFTSRFKCLEATVQTFEERNKQVLLDQRDLEERMRRSV